MSSSQTPIQSTNHTIQSLLTHGHQLGLSTVSGDQYPPIPPIPAPVPTKANRTQQPNSQLRRRKIINSQKWKQALADVRFYLDQLSIRPEIASKQLANILKKFQIKNDSNKIFGDSSTVPLDGRLEVLLAIKFNCSPVKLSQSWMPRQNGCMDVIDNWLKDAAGFLIPSENNPQTSASQPQPHIQTNPTAPKSSQRLSILLNILQLLDKLPISVDDLIGTSFGSSICRINKSKMFPHKDIAKLSADLESRWRELVREHGEKRNRVSNESSQATTTPMGSPTSTSSTTTKPSLSTVNPDEPPTVESRKRLLEGISTSDHTNDMKKQKVIVSNHKTTNEAKKVTGSLDKTEKLKTLTFAKKWTTDVSTTAITSTMTPGPSSTPNPFAQAMGYIKSDKAAVNPEALTDFMCLPKKSSIDKPPKHVRFKADEDLCQVKIVERLVYEGDQNELPPPWMDDARMLDADEGRYLHHVAKEIEEEMEWTSPQEVIQNEATTSNLTISDIISGEARTQEVREGLSMGVTYQEDSLIPETPSEPPIDASSIGHEERDARPRQIKLGAELAADPEVLRAIAFYQVHNSTDEDGLASNTEVSTLLAQLDPTPHRSPTPPSLQHRPQIHDNHIALCSSTDSTDLDNRISYPLTPSSNRSSFSFSDNSLRDLPPHLFPSDNLINAHPSLPTSPPVSQLSNKKRKRKRTKIKSHDQPTQLIPCRNGSDCTFGQNCRFRHDKD